MSISHSYLASSAVVRAAARCPRLGLFLRPAVSGVQRSSGGRVTLNVVFSIVGLFLPSVAGSLSQSHAQLQARSFLARTKEHLAQLAFVRGLVSLSRGFLALGASGRIAFLFSRIGYYGRISALVKDKLAGSRLSPSLTKPEILRGLIIGRKGR